MSGQSTPSRFTPQNKTTNERLSTNTVGLVAFSDFRKRRAEVLEQQEREAREAHLAANTPPDRSLTGTPNNAGEASETEKQAKRRKKRQKTARANKLSFDNDDEGDEDDGPVAEPRGKSKTPANDNGEDDDGTSSENAKKPKAKFAANTSVAVVPRALTKSALRKEAAEREALRKEFLVLQAAVKATDLAMPFVFYDGTNIPGGIVRVKKGDFVWVFLDKSRKVGADLGVGGDKLANARREWARVGVDDLMLVRGTIIIPHVSRAPYKHGENTKLTIVQHYEFYFFIMNKTAGPDQRRLFDYSAEAPIAKANNETSATALLSNPGKDKKKELLDVDTLEGFSDDPTYTKVVDRRWYERNKHIYPASVWQEFDPEKDYHKEIRRDPGGNAFFFSN